METASGHLAADGCGYLEMRDYKRAQWAWEHSHPGAAFMLWLRDAGHVSFGVDDERVDSSTEPSIPIPATKLAWEEITRIATELYQQWGDVETACADKFGASLLLDLGREVSTAMHKWPMEEKPRKVQELMCGECQRMTLFMRPPQFEGDHSVVECECGYSMTGEEFEQFVDMMKAEDDERKRKTVADTKRSRRKGA